MARPLAASGICPSEVWVSPAPAGARPAPRRSTCTPNGRPSTSISTRVPSEYAAVPTCFALVPARAGSKRVPAKNIRPLAGHPLLAYTIAAARESGIFAGVIVSTDSPEIAEIAQYYGAESPFLRPAAMATDVAADI